MPNVKLKDDLVTVLHPRRPYRIQALVDTENQYQFAAIALDKGLFYRIIHLRSGLTLVDVKRKTVVKEFLGGMKRDIQNVVGLEAAFDNLSLDNFNAHLNTKSTSEGELIEQVVARYNKRLGYYTKEETAHCRFKHKPEYIL